MITEATYQRDGSIVLVYDADFLGSKNWTIQDAPEQRDRFGLSEWLGKGNKIKDAPPPSPSPTPAVTTRMVDVWLRTTETEAAQLRQAIDTSDPRTVGIINATMRFDQSGEPFALLKGVADDIFSPARVSIILAPSET